MPQPFQPDLSAIRFSLRHVAQLPQLLALSRHQSLGDGLVDAVLDEAARFATNVLAPLNAIGDRQGAHLQPDGTVKTPDGFAQAYRQFVEMGWNAACAPGEIGGQGLPAVVQVALGEMWHGANMSFGLCPMLTQGAIELLLRFGSDELRAAYLPHLVSGEWTGTMGMTEPQAGSDIGAVRTRANLQEDGSYSITGTKIYITYGDHDFTPNIVHMVLAKLPGAPEGTKGLSVFLVPKILANGSRNGVRALSLEHKMGIHASPTAVLEFTEAKGWLVGTEHGGIQAMFAMMNAARLAVGVQALGVAAYAGQLATAYAWERVQGGKPIAHHPDVTRMLLGIDAEVHSLRALAMYAARLMDLARAHADGPTRQVAQQMADLLIPIVKAHITNRAFDVCSTALQVFGGMGYIEETGIAQCLRDVRIASIYEGTNGIQALDLAMRKAKVENGEILRALLAEITDYAQGLQAKEDALLSGYGTALLDAARQLEAVNIWVLRQHATGTPEAIASLQTQATLYLDLFGTVLQAYFLGVGAAQAEPGTPEEQGTRNRAHYFQRQTLPYAAAKAQIILGGI